jgi:hypothetical protein
LQRQHAGGRPDGAKQSRDSSIVSFSTALVGSSSLLASFIEREGCTRRDENGYEDVQREPGAGDASHAGMEAT